MTDVTPASKAAPATPETETDAVEPAPELVEPAAPVASTTEESVAPESVAPESVAPESATSADTATAVDAAPTSTEVVPVAATGEVAPVEPVAVPPQQQVVYMHAPLPPKRRGNRGVGTLLAVVGAIIYAAVYAVVGATINYFHDGDLFGPEFTSFVSSSFFWVPVIVFLIGLVIMVLLLNRAGWWAHILGSLILAVATYFGSIGVLLLLANVFRMTADPVSFADLAAYPQFIASAVAAREVSIWIGLGIAARGRRVKARNVETRAAFDREQEAKRAEYAGVAPQA